MIKLSSIQSYLARLSKKEKAVLYAAALFVSLAVIDRLVIYPIFAKIDELNEEISDKESGIKRSRHIIAHKDRILRESIKYKSFIRSAGSEEEEMTSFLKEIENLANKSAIYLVDMKPGGLEEAETSTKYLLNLNCESQLEQLVEFMYNIEKSDKLLSIEKYKISPKSKDSSVARCSMSIAKIIIP
jgi:Tfp pilus assembly protein PilO